MKARHDTIPLPLTSIDYTFILSLAKWFISLSNLSFKSFGSLQPRNTGEPKVGPWFRFLVAYTSPPYFVGPFSTAKAMYLGLIDRMIDQTLAGIRYPPDRIVDYYLILLEVRSLVDGCDELDSEIGYLKHGDDKGDHYMLNAENQVVSVIDWEW